MRSRPCKHTSSPVMPCLEAAAAAAVAALAAAAHRPLKQPENEEETVCHGCGLRGLNNNQPTTTAATPTSKQGDVALGADGQHTGQPLAVVAAPLHLDLVHGGIGQMWDASEGAMGKCGVSQATGTGPATCRAQRFLCREDRPPGRSASGCAPMAHSSPQTPTEIAMHYSKTKPNRPPGKSTRRCARWSEGSAAPPAPPAPQSLSWWTRTAACAARAAEAWAGGEWGRRSRRRQLYSKPAEAWHLCPSAHRLSPLAAADSAVMLLCTRIVLPPEPTSE